MRSRAALLLTGALAALAGGVPIAETVSGRDDEERSAQAAPAVASLPPTSGPHGYFDALVASQAHWKSYSLRDPKQLARPAEGGYANSNRVGLWVTYDPANDREPQRQDAAKVVIPTFGDEMPEMLVKDVSPEDTTIELRRGGIGNRRHVKIGDEIVQLTRPLPGRGPGPYIAQVARGVAGTSARAHAAGTAVRLSTNSLPNQVRLPLGTEDGYSYLITWDLYLTDSFLQIGEQAMSGFKAFQFSSPGDRIWLEPRLRVDGGRSARYNRRKREVGRIDVRTYVNGGGPAAWTPGSALHGPGTARGGGDALEPTTGENLTLKAGNWVRIWFVVDQRANDYDLMSLWVADETHAPVRLYDRVPINVGRGRPTQHIEKFWIEFNSSTDHMVRGGELDLVSYVRNVAVLRAANATDWTPLLVKPAPSGQ